jgi:hypothetical protein
VGSVQKTSGTEKNLPVLQMPAVQAEGKSAKGQRKDLHYLSEMQDRVREKKLKVKGDFSVVWLYQYQSKRIIRRK